jgi:hypothetical protein
MEHWSYSIPLNLLSATLYASIFMYGIVASVRDLYRLLNRWLG